MLSVPWYVKPFTSRHISNSLMPVNNCNNSYLWLRNLDLNSSSLHPNTKSMCLQPGRSHHYILLWRRLRRLFQPVCQLSRLLVQDSHNLQQKQMICCPASTCSRSSHWKPIQGLHMLTLLKLSLSNAVFPKQWLHKRSLHTAQMQSRGK